MSRVLLILSLIIFPLSANAIGLIRDAEIEKTIRDYGRPIWEASGLNPDSVNIFIVSDPSINAFAASGQNMFINTGLIVKSEDANVLIGVIAHETGHIVSGHIIKRMQEIEGLSIQNIASMVLGAAVSVAGLPDAGTAIMMGGQHVAQRSYLSYSREQEVVADKVGMNLLQNTKQSANGLLELMQILRRDQTLNFDKPDPYALSHPPTQERMSYIRDRVSMESGVVPDNFETQHKRMVAKLEAFLEKPEYTFQKYNDNSAPSIYARAVAHYRNSNFPKAIAEVDKLIAGAPNDPFFNELKGQFLFENGKLVEAEKYYQIAVNNYPDSGLLKYDLGKILIANNKLDKAIDYLQQASRKEPKNSEIWHQLAIAYGQAGDKGMLNLMLAEEAYLDSRKGEAKKYAELSIKNLPKDSPGAIRANDLIADVKMLKDKDKDKDKK